MANLEPIVKEWHAAESNIRASNKVQNAAASAAAQDKEATGK
jgi:hypothetical protein